MLYASTIFDKEEIEIIKEVLKLFNGRVTMVEIDGKVIFEGDESLNSIRRVSGNKRKGSHEK